MQRLVLAFTVFAAAAAAQQPTHPDSARPESTLAPAPPRAPVAPVPAITPSESLPPPAVAPAPASPPAAQPAAPTPPPAPAAAPAAPPAPLPPPLPTPAQLRFQQGLRTAGRGVAQIRDGLLHLENASRDSLRYVQAKRRLGGLCGAARLFLSSGRGRMDLSAYQDSTRLVAHVLLAHVDTLLRLAPLCESNVARTPDSVALALWTGLKGYDAALRDFRLATTPPLPPPAK